MSESAQPDDADDLRGKHFRELLHAPLTWLYVVGASLILGGALGAGFGLAVGAIAFVAIFLFGIWITFKVADSRAADDFFEVYAKQRGLTLGGKTSLPATTPLLRKGDDRYAERTLTGEFAPGTSGFLALFTYVTESTDSKGNRTKAYHPYTLGVAQVPECVGHVLSSTANASRGCARWRASRTSSAARKSGSSSNRPHSTTSTRSSAAKGRTRSGCGSSSRPPSSSG